MNLDTLGRSSAVVYKGDNFCDFLFALLHIKTLLKGVYLKWIEFALPEQILSILE